MSHAFALYAAGLGVFEVPTMLLLLLRGDPLGKATPWFDRVAPFERTSYAYMYLAVLALLATSRFLAAYLPRHRLLQIHNALVHALELPLFVSLLWLRQGPIPPLCYILVAFMVVNCGVFGFHAYMVVACRQFSDVTREKKSK
ncbi:hypothetical protein DQ04_01411070 [Trypanosoma grayi]|uniref:hypothetical protein n=1 Tax=Trypanosoma grayi TaxID=71804 RepID=UPI0004F4AC88|nr:hypothetical protein DQ04_01411070 [Trypanosoma grayi]KEG12805.1 hypothetical protein DQ04_01411070 [Trypanosoma grayi]